MQTPTSQTILITGGTGLIGTRLTQLLLEKGYRVSYLSREARSVPGVQVYQWDVERGQMDPEAVRTADYIVHLAGAGVADSRWTEKRKEEIINSRTQSTELLRQVLQNNTHQVKAFVSASAIGIYGAETGTRTMTEESPLGTDFLAQVCRIWESGAVQVGELGIRTVLLRIGIVLSDKGGALPKLVQPIRLGAGAALGTGRQVLSWIHLDDLCRLFIFALENEQTQGVYNAVAPNPVTNADLTRLSAEVLGKRILLPNVPAFALRLALGEMAVVVLGGSNVSGQKIAQTGFTFGFTDARTALTDLLSSS